MKLTLHSQSFFSAAILRDLRPDIVLSGKAFAVPGRTRTPLGQRSSQAANSMSSEIQTVDQTAPMCQIETFGSTGGAKALSDEFIGSCSLAMTADGLAMTADGLAMSADGLAMRADGLAMKAGGSAMRADGLAMTSDRVASGLESATAAGRVATRRASADALADVSAGCVRRLAAYVTLFTGGSLLRPGVLANTNR
jgi:hypothetical protein